MEKVKMTNMCMIINEDTHEVLVQDRVKDWYDHKKEERYIVFLLKTSSFSGTLISETYEGKVFWIDINKVKECKLSPDFIEMLNIFLGQGTEFFYEDLKLDDENKRWVKKFY